jgi:hypothetical protein
MAKTPSGGAPKAAADETAPAEPEALAAAAAPVTTTVAAGPAPETEAVIDLDHAHMTMSMDKSFSPVGLAGWRGQEERAGRKRDTLANYRARYAEHLRKSPSEG